VQVMRGQAAPGERSVLRHTFTVYAHCDDGLEAFVAAVRAQCAAAAVAGSGPLPFVATALPRPPQGSTVFSDFTYMEDPFQARSRPPPLHCRSLLARWRANTAVHVPAAALACTAPAEGSWLRARVPQSLAALCTLQRARVCYGAALRRTPHCPRVQHGAAWKHAHASWLCASKKTREAQCPEQT
jgi:hypothetical protein